MSEPRYTVDNGKVVGGLSSLTQPFAMSPAVAEQVASIFERELETLCVRESAIAAERDDLAMRLAELRFAIMQALLHPTTQTARAA